MERFEPKILGFLCNWCSYAAADSVNAIGKGFPPGARFVRVMCTGRIEPEFVLRGFRSGADGVVIFGCHLGDCHYRGGNYAALRRFYLLRKVLGQFGIEEGRLRMEWVSSCEPAKLVDALNSMVETVKDLGPLRSGETEEGCSWPG